MKTRKEIILTDVADNETRVVVSDNGGGIELRQRATGIVYVPAEDVGEFCRLIQEFAADQGLQ